MKKMILLIMTSISILLFSVSICAKDGAELFKSCIVCHQKDGMGSVALKAPRIAGQYEWYIKSTLLKFKHGERLNPVMLPIVKKLSEKDIDALAAYISKLTN